MSWATANLEKALGVDKVADWLQLSDNFEQTFSTYENRTTLVNAAKENFDGLAEQTKEQLKNTSAEEIASWGNYPDTSDVWYNAKIGVLYLYTTLQENKSNATLADTKKSYDTLMNTIETKKQDIPMVHMETLWIKKIETDDIISENITAVNNETETTTWTDVQKPIINQNDKIVLGSVENPITIPIIPERETIPEPTAKAKRQEKKADRLQARQEKQSERNETNREKILNIEKNELPNDLQNIKIGGEWTQKKRKLYIYPNRQKK